MYLLDYGLARLYRDAHGNVRPAREAAGFRGLPLRHPHVLIAQSPGTCRYASLTTHDGREMGRRDDLWSLWFLLVEAVTGALPWRQVRDKAEVARLKHACDMHALAARLPPQFDAVLSAIEPLQYADRPDYACIAAQLQRLLDQRTAGRPFAFPWQRRAPSPAPAPSDDAAVPACTPVKHAPLPDHVPDHVVDLERTPVRPLQLPQPSESSTSQHDPAPQVPSARCLRWGCDWRRPPRCQLRRRWRRSRPVRGSHRAARPTRRSRCWHPKPAAMQCDNGRAHCCRLNRHCRCTRARPRRRGPPSTLTPALRGAGGGGGNSAQHVAGSSGCGATSSPLRWTGRVAVSSSSNTTQAKGLSLAIVTARRVPRPA